MQQTFARAALHLDQHPSLGPPLISVDYHGRAPSATIDDCLRELWELHTHLLLVQEEIRMLRSDLAARTWRARVTGTWHWVKGVLRRCCNFR